MHLLMLALEKNTAMTSYLGIRTRSGRQVKVPEIFFNYQTSEEYETGTSRRKRYRKKSKN